MKLVKVTLLLAGILFPFSATAAVACVPSPAATAAKLQNCMNSRRL